jgi:hypothetical protein
VDFKGTEWDGVDGTHLARDIVPWWAVVSTIMNLRGSMKF